MTDQIKEFQLDIETLVEGNSRFPHNFTWEIVPVSDDVVTVKTEGREFLVSLSWARGNVRKLPDRSNMGAFFFALEASHPDVKEAIFV